MKTLASMLRHYFSKFKTRDLIMSGVFVAVIIAYGWDEGDMTSLPAIAPLPQQQYAPAPPQQPTNPGQYGSATSRSFPARAPQGQAEYQQGGYPNAAASNTHPGQPANMQRPAY